MAPSRGATNKGSRFEHPDEAQQKDKGKERKPERARQAA